jgi:biotin carboxylase
MSKNFRVVVNSIPMTDFVGGKEIKDASGVIEHLGTPVVVKARHESGGRGIDFVETSAHLTRLAKKYFLPVSPSIM